MIKIQNMFSDFPIIESKKFILRKLDILDDHEIFDIYSDEETIKYQGIKLMERKKQAKDYIENILRGYDNKYFIRWGISSKENDKIIGCVALHHIDYDSNNAQIGYILNKKYWNNNVMTQTLGLVIEYLFNNTELYRLEAEIHPENIASIKLSEKLGFVKVENQIKSVHNIAKQKYEDRITMILVNHNI